MTNPTTADRHLLVIADHIRSSAAGRGQLAAALGGRSEDLQAPGPPTDSGALPQGDSSGTAGPLDDFIAAISRHDAGPFEEFIAAISRPAGELLFGSGVQPPASRFMVRAAAAAAPTRPTKRNYNYFEELDAAIAERQLARSNQTASTLGPS